MEIDWLLSRAFLDTHPDDAALVLERLPAAEAAVLLEKIPPKIAAAVLQKMAPASAADCLAATAPERSGAVVAALPPDAAANLLRRMEPEAVDRLLTHTPPDASAPLRRLLQYPDGTAGALMDPRAVAVPGDIAVDEALARVRRSAHHMLYYLYVVDRDQRLVGVLNLRELMLASPEASIRSVMHTHVAMLSARADLTSLVAHPAWREFHALPVVDDAGSFIGVIRYETLRRVEADTAGGAKSSEALSTMLSFGELYWIGFAGMLAGLATTIFPPTAKEDPDRETDHG